MADYVIPSGAAGGNTAGAVNWKSSVANLAALPASGNTSGDARITLDTSDIYIWNGSAWVSSTAGAIALADGKLLVGSAGGVATAQTVSGDLTAVNTGAFTIANGAVTLAKLADLAADKLIGRGNGGGTGVPQAITLGTNLSMSGTTLNAAGGSGLSQGAANQIFGGVVAGGNAGDGSGINAGAITATVVVTGGNAVFTCSADCRQYVKPYSVVGTVKQTTGGGGTFGQAFVQTVSGDGLTITCVGLGEDNPLVTDAVASQLVVYGSPALQVGDGVTSPPALHYALSNGDYIIIRQAYWTGNMFNAGAWYDGGAGCHGLQINATSVSKITGLTAHALNVTAL